MHMTYMFMERLMDLPTEREIADVVAKFYERVRADQQLAEVFEVVSDWDEHLVRLGEFWSSVTLMSGSYKGNPLAMHLAHADRMRPELFERWLSLWKITTEELLSRDAAVLMQAKATRIAARFSRSIFGELPSHAPEISAARPFKVSAVFSEDDLPIQLQRDHAVTSWSMLRIRKGSVRYHDADHPAGLLIAEGDSFAVAPHLSHRFELVGPIELRVEFYHDEPTTSL